jgi:hypothetical protein
MNIEILSGAHIYLITVTNIEPACCLVSLCVTRSVKTPYLVACNATFLSEQGPSILTVVPLPLARQKRAFFLQFCHVGSFNCHASLIHNIA